MNFPAIAAADSMRSARPWLACLYLLALAFFIHGQALADTARTIDRDADAALERVFEESPVAVKLAEEAEAVLIFPSIVKAGFGVGGQYGEGVLRQGGQSIGYYRSSAVSYGLQIGAQSFGYVLFLMTPEALEYLETSDGWEVGVGPSIVIMDEGMAKTMTTTTMQEDIFALVFGQKGLMAGAGIQGSKISAFEPDE